MLWLCLHFPLLPLESFTRAQAGAHSQAWLVAESQRVAQCNEAAAAAGIAPGMSLATAYAIGTSLRVVDRDRQRERIALGQLGQYIVADNPDFDSRTYGKRKLSDVVQELKRFETRKSGNQLEVRRVD